MAPAAASPPTPASPATIPATTPTTTPAPAPEPKAAAPTRPADVPDKYWNADKGVDHTAWSKDFNEHVAFKAAEDSKRLSLPQTPDAYKAELPADFKTPEGVKFEFKQDDPLLAQAKTMAHGMGISQENFSKLLGLYAGAQVGTQQEINTARNAEVAKLGAAGTSRVTAITTFFKATLGDADGAQLASRMFTAHDIEIAEKLVARFASQGGGSFSASGRQPDVGNKIDNATWDKMTYTEKKEHAARFPQQVNGSGA